MRAEPAGELLDLRHALVAALGHDVGRAELAGELLAGLVAAHRDDALGAQLLGGEHAEQADRAVADDRDRLAGAHLGRIGGKPARAQDIGGRQQTRDQVVRRERPAWRPACRRPAARAAARACAPWSDGLALHAPALVTRLADGAGVV